MITPGATQKLRYLKGAKESIATITVADILLFFLRELWPYLLRQFVTRNVKGKKTL